MRGNLSQRPRVEVTRTGWDYVAEVLSLSGVVMLVLLPAVLWSDLPDRMPRHFGIDGDPTAWTGRGIMVVPPILGVLTYIGLTLLARIPHHFNYPWPITEQNAPIMYRLSRSMVHWLKATLIWMFLFLQWSQARVGMGDAERINPFAMFAFLIGIHVVLGVFLYRSYRFRDGDTGRDPSTLDDT